MPQNENEREGFGWREVVQRAAYQATLEEAMERHGTEDLPFNYRWEHVKAVARLAVRLADLTGADPEVVEAAAWLHDIRKRGGDDNHGHNGATVAEKILSGSDFPTSKIAGVVQAISQHVGLTLEAPLQPLEAAVLWDADKLTKLGATAVMHNIGFKLANNESGTRQLLTALANKSWHSDTVNCFHTDYAQAAGKKRMEIYRKFWEQVQNEIDGRDLNP
ncbi:MAG: HD domain-containing protein [Anaerolineales bacterium]|nr:HD domain-containing protein [Anaerolineales bacterium]